MNRHLIKGNHEHVTLVHFAKSNSNIVKQLTEKELSKECKWFSLEELEKLNEGISSTVKNYAKQALQTINSKI
tara:strand:- start:1323 stop:1541 length:219 start_codon:yes stop_codon:yes gene_type:complete